MECPVCFEEINDNIPLPCLHWVCRKCILLSLKKPENIKRISPKDIFKCPICRHKFNMDEHTILCFQYLIRSQKI